jgi:Na+/melibiose symporter-like transporter
MFFFCSLYVQNILKFTPVQSGLSFLPVPVIIGIVSFQAPKLLGKFGFKKLAVAGIAMTTLGTFIMSFLGVSS